MVVSKSDIQSLLMSFLVLIETQPIAMEGRELSSSLRPERWVYGVL